MAQQTVVVLVCDVCSAEGDGVETHALTVDRRSVEVEACGRCWGKADKALGPLLDAGRRVRAKRGG